MKKALKAICVLFCVAMLWQAKESADARKIGSFFWYVFSAFGWVIVALQFEEGE